MAYRRKRRGSSKKRSARRLKSRLIRKRIGDRL